MSRPSCRPYLHATLWGGVGLPSLGGFTHRFGSLKDFDPESLGLAGLTYA